MRIRIGRSPAVDEADRKALMVCGLSRCPKSLTASLLNNGAPGHPGDLRKIKWSPAYALRFSYDTHAPALTFIINRRRLLGQEIAISPRIRPLLEDDRIVAGHAVIGVGERSRHRAG